MKVVKRLLFFSSLVLISNFSYSQLNKANFHYDAYAFQKAIPKYEKYLKKKPYDPEALFRLANAYRLTGEVKQAERWFEKAVQYYDRPIAKFYYALVLMTNNKYEDAERWFRNYALVAPSAKDGANARNLADYAAKLHQHGVNYKPFEVFKTEFNSEELDFSPVLFQDTLLIFASNREHEVKKDNNKDNWTNANFMDLYKVRVYKNNHYGEPELLAPELKSKYHESSAAFSPTFDTLYFTRSDYSEEEGRGFDKFANTRLKIFISQEALGEWGKAIELSFNSNQFSTCHPALSPDGRTMVFASDRPGGYGQMDLYVIYRQGDGEWSEPENLGADINTAGNEIFPYIHKDGNLYFSSDGQAGLGGLDIFTSPKKEKLWGFPVNIGAPLNSTRDDFGIVADRSFSKGYFSSNREGKDDIYSFSKGKTIMLEGLVVVCQDGEPIEGASVVLYEAETDSLANRNTSIDGYFTFEVEAGKRYRVVASKDGFGPCNDCPGEAYVTIPADSEENYVKVELPMCSGTLGEPLVTSRYIGKGRNICGTVINSAYNRPMPNTKVVITSLCSGEESVIFTDANGSFFAPIEEGCDYVVEGHKNKFTGRMVGVSTSDSIGVDCIPVEVPLSFDRKLLPPELSGKVPIYAGMIIELYNIYFDLDKYFIRQDAVSDLEELYGLLIKYPDMRGELSAHTDSRATHAYNITLSENRAKSAYNYLVRKGIDPSRLTWRGYGETRLKNECADGVECSEKQHQRNRRVEFRVTYFNGTVDSKEYDYFLRSNSSRK